MLGIFAVLVVYMRYIYLPVTIRLPNKLRVKPALLQENDAHRRTERCWPIFFVNALHEVRVYLLDGGVERLHFCGLHTAVTGVRGLKL